MIKHIQGLHHVTSIASDPRANNAFFTGPLGLRRVKKTVNFDAPDVYHLYYGDEVGTPGGVMTYFPFPNAARGRPGGGEVGTTRFSIPRGTARAWADRLSGSGVTASESPGPFGETLLSFAGPDGDAFALVESDDPRDPWTGGGLSADMAIRGFHSAHLRPRDNGATEELLRFMGYEEVDRRDGVLRLAIGGGNAANVIDVETLPAADWAAQGAGSVHHIAFSVKDRQTQDAVRKALTDTGYRVTPPIDRDYFWAIYFRTPGGILFEVATDAPGFDRDEDRAHLGETLKLPRQHEHLRAQLERDLQPIGE